MLAAPAIACRAEPVSQLTWRARRVWTRVWGSSSRHLGARAVAVATDTVPQSSRLTPAAESLAALWTRLALPCLSGTDPLPLRALEATLGCLLMWAFSVFIYGVPRKLRKRTRQCPRRLWKPTSRCLTGPWKALVWTQAAQSPCPALVCSTPQKSRCSRRCSPKWGSLTASWGPRARLRQSGSLRLPPSPALGLRTGARGAAPTRVPVLTEGLSSSPLPLKRDGWAVLCCSCSKPSALVCCHSHGCLLSPRTLRPSPRGAVREALARHGAAVVPLRSWAPPPAWP